MKTSAWKFEETNGEIIYNIQFDEVPWKLKKTLFEAMKDWEQWAVGWYKNSGNQLFSFRKAFKNQQDWESWAARFPMQIAEKRIWGDREKVIIHGKKSK
jgi:hypothetical protein